MFSVTREWNWEGTSPGKFCVANGACVKGGDAANGQSQKVRVHAGNLDLNGIITVGACFAARAPHGSHGGARAVKLSNQKDPPRTCTHLDLELIVTATSGHVSRRQCTIKVLEAGTLDATRFSTTGGDDVVTVNGVKYSGGKGPEKVRVKAGDVVSFAGRKLSKGRGHGWKLCLSTNTKAAAVTTTAKAAKPAAATATAAATTPAAADSAIATAKPVPDKDDDGDGLIIAVVVAAVFVVLVIGGLGFAIYVQGTCMASFAPPCLVVRWL